MLPPCSWTAFLFRLPPRGEEPRRTARWGALAGAIVAAIACLAAPQSGWAQAPATYDTTTVDGTPAVVVSEGDGGGIEHPAQGRAVTWTSDYQWVLDGLVFVNEGQDLRIEAGTVVKGRTGDGANASALVVARGGQIYAEGTAEAPIIFTTVKDDVTRTDDLPANFRGGWGGLIIMGRAPLNTVPNVLNVEGISLNDRRNQYGGDDPDDDSGVLRYVSIRHGGTVLEKGNEINGITLAGVGRGTTLEYVEVYNNVDDGFEWFGGTVDGKHLVSAFTTDDSFDIDQGYRGRGQFWLAIQNSAYADRAAEHDGGEKSYGGEGRKPYATPQIANATYVGSGIQGAGGTALYLRDNFAGAYYNSVFVGFPGEALYVEDLPGDGENDARARFEEGTLKIEGSVFANVAGAFAAGSGSRFDGLVQNDGSFGTALANYLQENNTLASQPPLETLARDNTGGLTRLDPGAAGAAAEAGVALPEENFFDPVDYVGAVGPSSNWAASWTFVGQGGTQYPGLGILQK